MKSLPKASWKTRQMKLGKPKNMLNLSNRRTRLPMLVASILLVAGMVLVGSGTAHAQTERGAIPSLRIDNNEPGQINLAWETPDPTPSDSYRISWTRVGLESLSCEYPSVAERGNAYAAADQNTFTLYNLTSGDEYEVRLQARYAGGENDSGPWFGPWTATTIRVKRDPPAAPFNFTVTQDPHDSLTIAWTAPQDDGITGYRILRGTQADYGNLRILNADTGSTSTEYIDSTVVPNTTYFYAVVALSIDGDGAQSGLMKTRAGIAGMVTLTSEQPGQLVVNWETPDLEPTDYRLSWALSGSGFRSWRDANDAQGGNLYPAADQNTLTLDNLMLDEEYEVQIRARYHGGNYSADPWSGPWSATATFMVQEHPPASSDNTVTTTRGARYVFTEEDFNFVPGIPGDTLQSIQIVGHPTFRFGATSKDGRWATDQVVSKAELDDGSLVYTSSSSLAGTDSFVFKVTGNWGTSTSQYTMTIKANNPATGQPTINGIAQVGQRLNHDTVGISDPDGLRYGYAYQWIRVDADGTSNQIDIPDGWQRSSYTLVADDVGKRIKLRLDFTDGRFFAESLTSDAYPASGTVTGPPASSDNTVTTTRGARYVFTEEDFNFVPGIPGDTLQSIQIVGHPTFRFGATSKDGRWATDQVVSKAELDDGSLVYTSSSSLAGTDSFVFKVTGNWGTSTSQYTMTIKANNPATGQPTINGIAQVGQRLNHDTVGISDPDGLRYGYAYQWIRVDADGTSNQIDIPDGWQRSSYTLVADDVGKRIKLRLDFTDGRFFAESLTSDAYPASGAVAPKPNTPATGLPTITGTVQVGETLTVETSSISDPDGMDNVTFTYQWTAGGTDIEGATGSSYTIAEADEGLIIQVRVSFTDDAGNHEAPTSEGTEVVTSAETVTGPPASSDNTVTTTRGARYVFTEEDFNFVPGIPGDTLQSIQIVGHPTFRFGATSKDGRWATDQVVSKAELDDGSLVYTSSSSLAGTDSFVFKVTGNWGTSTSQYTMTIKANNPATGQPTINGIAQVGQRLNHDTVGISDPDGLRYGYAYQWIRVDADGTSNQIDIPDGWQRSSYTLVADDVGKRIKLRLDFTDGRFFAESLTSDAYPASGAVAPKPNTPATGLPTITGTVQVGETLTVETSSISDPDGMDNVTFTYQWTAGGTDIEGATGSSYTIAEADEGLIIQVRVSFTDDAGNHEAPTSEGTEVVTSAE